MLNAGIYHPFNFISRLSDLDTRIIYKTPYLNFILTGNFADVRIINFDTGATAAATVTSASWDLNGITLDATKVQFSPSAGQRYYLYVDYNYSDCIIEYGSCVTEILTYHDCSNHYYDWENDSFAIQILMSEASELTPVFESEEKIIITDKGANKRTINQSRKQRIQYLAPTGHINILNGLKINSYVALNTPLGYRELKNIEVESAEQDNGRYSIFTVTFEEKDILTDGSSCCEVINIDDILSPDIVSGGAECDMFSVAIDNTANVLSVILTDPPVGTVTYKWYKNGVYLSAATTIAIESHGDYRVDVRVSTCRATASYFKDNPCSIYQIDVTKVGNEINATVSNEPDMETTTYSVVLNGVEVATSVPYTALEDGTYYIYATAGECLKSKGIIVILEDTDCDFTIDIIDNTTTLDADTDAGTPAYLWELETSTGRATIGTAATINKSGKGIYWLSITNGTCTKETYIYDEPSVISGYCVLARSTGYEFTVYGVNMLEVLDYVNDYLVTVNGVTSTYVSGTPTLANTYSIKADGKIIFAAAFSLSNSLIVIKKL